MTGPDRFSTRILNQSFLGNMLKKPTELLSAKGVINRNSIHTGPERNRLIPIKLQLGPGVEIICALVAIQKGVKCFVLKLLKLSSSSLSIVPSVKSSQGNRRNVRQSLIHSAVKNASYAFSGRKLMALRNNLGLACGPWQKLIAYPMKMMNPM